MDDPRDIPSAAPLGGLASDKIKPTTNSGTANKAPEMGPRAPISINALRSGMGERIFINAPNVPNGGMAGMK